jgi:hypothetical protein
LIIKYFLSAKCAFGVSGVEYLGHIVSHDGVHVDPKKIEVMKDWPRQKNLKSLRGFLGLAGYYKKFIRSYGKIATPLKTFLERNAFIWNYFIEWAFQDLKIAMCTTLVLTLPNFTKTFVSECDASSKGIESILMQ